MGSKASQVFRYAIALGLCQFNVTDQISGFFIVGKNKHRAALTDEQMLGQLLRNINKNIGRGDITIDYAVKILAHVFVRPGELCAANRWIQILKIKLGVIHRLKPRIRQPDNILFLYLIKF